MATEGEAYAISKALGDINLERIRGPGDEKFVSLGSLWKEQTAVIYVLRRFGCRLCRANAAELSKTVLPILEENKIRVVAVGIEHLGVEEFLEGGYWDGELYIDNGKKIANALSIKSVGYLGAIKMLVADKEVKQALSKTKAVPGNLKGDGMQLGATFVLSKAGETLLDFRQKNFADHTSAESILVACGLDPGLVKGSGGGIARDNVCGDTGES
eukprot:TRINITY_DN1288_c0_g1_i1.p1 TRINITY_DN1288_c0_g1~~TRINITY_DN1288_c0_g1_i1.p1  ORF type:complete len:214 (+),score=37.02 TRINITY_DN1288_c0_g1_i1:217-858(+)